MTAQSPSAYLVSAFLHASVVALLLLFVAINQRKTEDAPTIFELVAGEGNNYAAREAPALGEPQAKGMEPTVKLPVPVPVRPVEPEPPQAVIEPVEVAPAPVPVQPVKTPPTAKPNTPPPPNFVRDIKRLSEKRAANIERKHKADQKVAAERARKEAELQAKRMSKEEFDRLNAKQKSAASSKTPVKVPSIAEGIRGGVAGGSTANSTGGAGGKAMERGEMDLTDAYVALILQRIRQSMEQANFSDQLSVRLQFSVSPSGTVNGVGILESSGSNEFDRAVLEAFRTIPDLGPPPNRKGGTFLVNLKMSDRG